MHTKENKGISKEKNKVTNTSTSKFSQYPSELRPRERMETFGVEHLNDVELLAILLATGSREYNVMELSTQLLQRYKGITGLQKLSLVELTEQKGIGKAKATTILAAIELGKRVHINTFANRDVIRNTKDAGVLLQHRMRHLDREHFVVMMLTSSKAIIGVETISIGTLNNSLVHPREVFKQAIRNSASTVILAHNHPSGDCTPSGEDIRITKRLVEAGKIIGIEVIDHVIVGEDSYYSFCENGLIGTELV